MKPNIKKLKFRYNRIKSINNELKYILVLALALVFSYEFILRYYYAPVSWFYDLGQILIKLSYSYISAFIFYFLVVHSPKERKKVLLTNLIHNKIHIVHLHIKLLLIDILKKPEKLLTTLTEDDIYEIFESLPRGIGIRVRDIYFTKDYERIEDYIHDRCQLIHAKINEILIFHEVIDSDALYSLSQINSALERLLSTKIDNYKTENLLLYGDPFYYIILFYKNIISSKVYNLYYEEARDELSKRKMSILKKKIDLQNKGGETTKK